MTSDRLAQDVINLIDTHAKSLNYIDYRTALLSIAEECLLRVEATTSNIETNNNKTESEES